MISPTLPPHVRQLLQGRFGYQDFRPGQAAVIGALLQGQHVLAVMPTGSGKSLCYQLPALLRDGCTVVISPLIALMKDQVDSLRAQGIAATFINSTLSLQDQRQRLRACQAGMYRLLFVAPERFRNAHFLQAIVQTRVPLFAVDEAHCISEWGHDFRPDYLRLRQAIEHLGRPQVLALTATATVEVQRDIVHQLGCRHMQSIVTGFDRANLTYRVQTLNTPTAKLHALADLLAVAGEGSVIVYAATRRAVEEIAAFLQARGHEVLIYHAGLPDTRRRHTQEAFMAQPSSLIVATNAFGMGVDKPDVRSVVHFNLPRSMEAYYQEAGRAGRDGLPAQCLLLFSYGDVKIQEFLLEQSYPPRQRVEAVYAHLVDLCRRQPEVPWHRLLPARAHGGSDLQLAAALKLLEKAGYVECLSDYQDLDGRALEEPFTRIRLATDPVVPQRLHLDTAAQQRRKQHELKKLRYMVGYANAQQCRRRRILEYFGEAQRAANCGACDACLRQGVFAAGFPPPTRLPSEAEWVTIQKVLSCVARMQGRYGRARIIQVLMGSQARAVRDSALTRLSTYGILQGTPRSALEATLDALLAAGCIQIVGDEFPKLALTALGQDVMRRRQTIALPLPTHGPATAHPSLSAADRAVRPPSISTEVVTRARADSPSPLPGATRDNPTATDHRPYDATLLERLRVQRTALAKAQALPPYCIFNDRTLRDIATQQPIDHAGLLQIHGVGEIKARKYGDVFLTVIREHLTPRPPS